MQERIIIMAFIFGLPFVFAGAYYLFQKFNILLKVKKGHYRVVLRLPNYRKKKFLLKPESGLFKFKNNQLSLNTEPGYVYFDGNVPVVEYDYYGNQINFNEKTGESKNFEGERLSSVMERIYNLGFSIAAEKTKKLEQMVMIIVGTTGLTLLILLLLLHGTLEFGSLAVQ